MKYVNKVYDYKIIRIGIIANNIINFNAVSRTYYINKG